MSKICIIQLPTLSMSEARIDYYIRVVKDNGACMVVLGEYVLNSFLNELLKMPKNLIKEQISHKKELMRELAKKYDITIVAPFLHPKGDGFIKGISKFSPKSTKFWQQNILINYHHWNEKKFFLNDAKEINLPVFNHDKFKYGVISGFESHFDICWQYMMKNRVDVVLVPTSSTFDSNLRWEELLKIRAFTNQVYVLRANRIGKTKFEGKIYEFYGDSFAVSPNGIISSRLKKEEGILLFELCKDELKEERKAWKFREIIEEREIK
ncbi:carbon-nitrogen hydrolase family protein [Campylobacter blaseri]|uniref:Carbon-nitrogen hydrolase family protein n=1 Tax=Campylobacter blaseri TaxID=2042961 RepID=A0A2P8R0H8_9BACT|nr:carbon-nitrogen hydrolase family protein [Campylobacter blaseri]PSM52005.1 carbon-nitrogen hydrolase family protein [Campylobacter blaseri]PSM53790.1 carbon-nitrogen hydrolase family protein [Campylobacter blaseri]QKF85658.1 carbon-nitrogen hydrolase family protein [Campylobacter blaseri]